MMNMNGYKTKLTKCFLKRAKRRQSKTLCIFLKSTEGMKLELDINGYFMYENIPFAKILMIDIEKARELVAEGKLNQMTFDSSKELDDEQLPSCATGHGSISFKPCC